MNGNSNGHGWNYDRIKALAKEQGCTVLDLIALAPQNDPFYCGTQGDIINGNWFFDLWQTYGFGTGVHLRRVHYRIISQEKPVPMPNGKPYENTLGCWKFLEAASKAARYLDLVPITDFVDRRNPDAQIYASWPTEAPSIYVDDPAYFGAVELPAFPDLPSYGVTNYEGAQRYHLELWCEKSTMNDVLVPLCRRYRANLVTGVGELSITAVSDLVQKRIDAGHPCRIFYISDFDPAGLSMPVAVARKIEHQLGDLDADVQLTPIVLTADQVRRYRLPRTPIKESEKRGARFEERYGEGAVELDALEALYPGRLSTIVRDHLRNFYDDHLGYRVAKQRDELDTAIGVAREQVLSQYAPDIDSLRTEYETLKEEVDQRLIGLTDRIQRLWRAISADLERVQPDIDDYAVPEAAEVDRVDNGVLFDNTRSYVEQIHVYKAFQGKAAVALEQDDGD